MDQLRSLGRDLAIGSQAAWTQSKEFLDLVKAIGEAKSKSEEDRIVLTEVDTLKKRIVEPDVPRKKMKEYIMRLIYVEMLGHDASFGYIHAVKMTHDDSLLLKKVGYLAVTLFLDDRHELIILIVNTIQKDLKNDNHLIVCAALGAVCKLINEETIPAVLPQVVELVNHPKETVRKKAVMALHRFYQRSPDAVSHVIPRFRQVLCDKDPSVMAAALNALYDLISADAAPYKNLTTSFVSILKQVAEHRLPKLYDYHRTPAPFVQIKILKILALLGVGDKVTSEGMYSVLGDVLRRGNTGINIGNAILYECICTVTAIYANTKLLETSAEITSRFLKSDSHNLKYMGIDALGRVVKINPEFATEHQLAVIDCLEDPDETLKRKTLDLLYKMTKPSNAEVIVQHMITYMGSTTDKHVKREIADRVIELAERFAPNNQWFINTMNSVFEIAGDLVRPAVAHDLMRLIAEGTGEEDVDADNELRASAVESYLELLEKPKLPSILLQVICWVLGEYGTISGGHRPEEIITRLIGITKIAPTDDSVKGYVIHAITKICCFQMQAREQPALSPEAEAFMDEMRTSVSTELQQRAYEQQTLLTLPSDFIAEVVPMDASCEDIEVDPNLSFLDAFVANAVANGARPYIPESERPTRPASPQADTSAAPGPSHSSLRFEAYAAPPPPPRGGVASFSMDKPGAAAASAGPSEPAALISIDDGRMRRRGSMDELRGAGSRSGSGGSGEVVLRLDGIARKWGASTGPAVSAGPSGYGGGSSNGHGGGHSDPGRSGSRPGGSGSPEPRDTRSTTSYDRRKKEAEVSEEKLRLASSLFGGAGAGSKAPDKKSSRSGQEGRPSSAPSKPVSNKTEQPKPPPAPVPDLLDLSDDPTPGTAAAAAATPTPSTVPDPFKQLEGLLDGPVAAPSGGAAANRRVSTPDIDLLSLYDSSAPGQETTVASQVALDRNSSSVQSKTVSPAAVVQNAHVSATKKIIGSSNQAQKDAVSLKAGVTKDGKSKELFKDLL